jgi:hypothetical protein
MTTQPRRFLKRSLIFLHRSLGVALSVLFLLWFGSGIVVMYWDGTTRASAPAIGGNTCRSWTRSGSGLHRRKRMPRFTSMSRRPRRY